MELIYAVIFIQGLFWVVLSLSEITTSKYVILKTSSLAFISVAAFIFYSRISDLIAISNNSLFLAISLLVIWICLSELRKKIISVSLTPKSLFIGATFVLLQLILLVLLFYTEIKININYVLIIAAVYLSLNVIWDIVNRFNDYAKLSLKTILILDKPYLISICMNLWQLVLAAIIVLSLIFPINQGIIDWIDIATIVSIPIMFIFEYLNYKYPVLLSKFKTSNNNKYNSDILSEKIKNLMENEKLFLKNDLSLDDFADAAGVNNYELSHYLNHQINSSFYRLVNKYRVEEVKKMLNSNINNKFTLLAIAFECGFNSKSSFNRIFKEFTGLTPKEYKSQKKEQ
jgi:AraC-like DNA-binding protein